MISEKQAAGAYKLLGVSYKPEDTITASLVPELYLNAPHQMWVITHVGYSRIKDLPVISVSIMKLTPSGFELSPLLTKAVF